MPRTRSDRMNAPRLCSKAGACTLIMLASGQAMAGVCDDAPAQGVMAIAHVDDDNQASDPADLLRGPSARPTEVPGSVSDFGGNASGTRQRTNDARSDRVLERTLRLMATERAPEAVRLSAEQQRAIREIMSDYEAARSAYRQEHAEAYRTLREQAYQGRSRGNDGQNSRRGQGQNQDQGQGQEQGRNQQRNQERTRPNSNSNSDSGNGNGNGSNSSERTISPEQREARQKLRELDQAGPSIEPVRGEVWAVLNDQQRTYVEEAIAQANAQAQADRNSEMGMAAGDPMAPGRAGGAGAPQQTGVAEIDRFIERLMAMPERDRERIVQRLNGMLDRFDASEREAERRQRPPSVRDGLDMESGEEGEANQDRPRRTRRNNEGGRNRNNADNPDNAGSSGDV